MAQPLRLNLTKRNLDKLLRLKRAEPRELFPEMSKADLSRFQRVRQGRQVIVWDREKSAGLNVLLSPGAEHRADTTVTLRVVYYDRNRPGVPRYHRLGRYPSEIADPDDARMQAARIRADAKQEGIDPKRPKFEGDFASMVSVFLEQHASNNRSGSQTARIFARYVLPEWSSRQVEEIGKRDVSALLAKIRAGQIVMRDGGKTRRIGSDSVATAVLAQLSSFFNWYDGSYASDDFRSPITRGMRKLQGRAVVRSRVLSDDELRVMWPILDRLGVYGACLQAALLTAQRFHRVSGMRRAELHSKIKINGTTLSHVWDPSSDDEPDNKHASLVPLSELCRETIKRVPIINDSEFVFSENGRNPFNGWSRSKNRLDDLIAEELPDMPDWQHRDLRRTARTLMARAGVSTEVAEHCLGHAMPSIQRTYDRYDYALEKRDAFDRLAKLLSDVLAG